MKANREQHDPFLAMMSGQENRDDTNTIMAGDDPWAGLRQQAREAYDRQGFPSPKTEHWKYTHLNPLTKRQFSPASLESTQITDAVCDEGSSPGGIDIDAYQIVMVNGRLRADLLPKDDLPAGVHIQALRELEGQNPQIPLGQILSLQNMPLASVNTAHFCDGIVITVADNTVLDRPLHILSIGEGDEESPPVFYPRILAIFGDKAQGTLLESHRGQGVYLTNSVTEIRLGARAHCGHYKLQHDSQDSFHIAATGVTIQEEASYENFVLQIGSHLARNEVQPRLIGEQSEARLIGAYIGGGQQHIDNTTFIEHAVAHCSSREVYKGVLEDSAHGVFQGKILVQPDAQKTDGYQLNRALLLSDEAEINSKPELEIYADDVICSHGATAGQLDPEQLFYLRARGLDEQTARGLLIHSFLQEAVDEIAHPDIARAFTSCVRNRLGTPE